MSEWHYTKSGQQLGPVSSAQLKQLAAEGQISTGDMVWKEGMTEWAQAASIKGLFAQTSQNGEIPVSSPSQPVSAIPYYNPTGGLTDRVQKTLKGFPPATGIRGEWPLSDQHLIQLKEAESHRKHIRNLASLFQLFFVVGAIVAPIVLIGALFSLGSGSRRQNAEAMEMLFSAATCGAFVVLYYFAARETKRCRIWPALVFTILISLAILFVFGSFFFAMSSRFGSGDGSMILVPLLWSLLPGAVLFMCIKTMTAIPKFLACPIWAQEALVNAKL